MLDLCAILNILCPGHDLRMINGCRNERKSKKHTKGQSRRTEPTGMGPVAACEVVQQVVSISEVHLRCQVLSPSKNILFPVAGLCS
jgi:hypothetical protein